MEDVEVQAQRLLVMKDSESGTVIGHADRVPWLSGVSQSSEDF